MRLSDEVSGRDIEEPGVYVYTKEHLKRTAEFTHEKFFEMKIGMAEKQSMRSRIGSQQKTSTSPSDEILVLRAFPHPDPRPFERKIHTILKAAGLHVRTQDSGVEWFRASPELIDTIAEAIGLANASKSKISNTSDSKLAGESTTVVTDTTSTKKDYDLTHYTAPFTIKDSEGREIVREELLATADSLYVTWITELSKDTERASKMLENFTATYRLQSENDKHRNQAPQYYVAGHNGVYVHPHSKVYPLNALKDIKRVSDYFRLNVEVLDSKGQELLADVSVNKLKGKGQRVKAGSFTISDSLGNNIVGRSLSGAHEDGDRGIYGQWLKKLCQDPKTQEKLSDLARSSTTRHFKVSKVDPSPEGKKFYLQLSESLWAYITLSKDNTIKSIESIANQLGIQAELKEIDS